MAKAKFKAQVMQKLQIKKLKIQDSELTTL